MNYLPIPSQVRSESGRVSVIFWITVIVITLGLLFSYYTGTLAGQGDYKRLIMIFTLIATFVICMTLKSRLWLLIPATFSLSGALGGVPLPFSVAELAQMFVFGMFMVFYALKVPIRKATFTSVDWLMVANVVYLGTVFVRNPVGTQVLDFGSDMVGGRPYFGIATALITYWVYTHVTLDRKTMKIFPLLLLGGSAFTAFLGVLTRYVPGTASLIQPIYSGVNIDSLIQEEYGVGEGGGGLQRLGEVGSLGGIGSQYLMSMNRPVALLSPARIFRLLLFIGCLVGILLSGFRTAVFQTAVFFLLSSYFYNGSRDVVRAMFTGLALLVLLLAGQGTLFNLPSTAQRALSFLPAQWTAELAVDDAESSSEWRFNMWRTVWKSDKYLHNRIFGDGFGFKASELKIQLEGMVGGTGYIGGEEAENQMVTGAFHSGPLSAIRVVGFVGLILYTALMIASARLAWRSVNEARGTPFFGLTIFVSLPLIYMPFGYWFVFGGYDGSMPFSIFQLGLLHMINNSREDLSLVATVVEPTVSALPEIQPLRARARRQVTAR